MALTAALASPLGDVELKQRHERAELAAAQSAKTRRLDLEQKEDASAFRKKRHAERGAFDRALKDEKRAVAESVKGASRSDKKAAWARYALKRKQERRDFEDRRRLEDEEFFRRQRADREYLERVEAEERRQLDGKQKVELAGLKP